MKTLINSSPYITASQIWNNYISQRTLLGKWDKALKGKTTRNICFCHLNYSCIMCDPSQTKWLKGRVLGLLKRNAVLPGKLRYWFIQY